GKPGSVIGMGMGKQDRLRRNPPYLSEPVCPAVDHYTRTTVLDEQRAMIPMSPGAKLNASSGPEKGQLHMRVAYLIWDAALHPSWPFTCLDRNHGGTADAVPAYPLSRSVEGQ
ncbi:MAG: hypothetical protein WBS14_20350, partial [Rhodomicrobium sp.]